MSFFSSFFLPFLSGLFFISIGLRDDSKGGSYGGGEVLVRGVPRCCSPSAPGKEREKEGEFFFVVCLRRRTPIQFLGGMSVCMSVICILKGLRR